MAKTTVEKLNSTSSPPQEDSRDIHLERLINNIPGYFFYIIKPLELKKSLAALISGPLAITVIQVLSSGELPSIETLALSSLIGPGLIGLSRIAEVLNIHYSAEAVLEREKAGEVLRKISSDQKKRRIEKQVEKRLGKSPEEILTAMSKKKKKLLSLEVDPFEFLVGIANLLRETYIKDQEVIKIAVDINSLISVLTQRFIKGELSMQQLKDQLKNLDIELYEKLEEGSFFSELRRRRGTNNSSVNSSVSYRILSTSFFPFVLKKIRGLIFNTKDKDLKNKALNVFWEEVARSLGLKDKHELLQLLKALIFLMFLRGDQVIMLDSRSSQKTGEEFLKNLGFDQKLLERLINALEILFPRSRKDKSQILSNQDRIEDEEEEDKEEDNKYTSKFLEIINYLISKGVIFSIPNLSFKYFREDIYTSYKELLEYLKMAVIPHKNLFLISALASGLRVVEGLSLDNDPKKNEIHLEDFFSYLNLALSNLSRERDNDSLAVLSIGALVLNRLISNLSSENSYLIYEVLRGGFFNTVCQYLKNIPSERFWLNEVDSSGDGELKNFQINQELLSFYQTLIKLFNKLYELSNNEASKLEVSKLRDQMAELFLDKVGWLLQVDGSSCNLFKFSLVDIVSETVNCFPLLKSREINQLSSEDEDYSIITIRGNIYEVRLSIPSRIKEDEKVLILDSLRDILNNPYARLVALDKRYFRENLGLAFVLRGLISIFRAIKDLKLSQKDLDQEMQVVEIRSGSGSLKEDNLSSQNFSSQGYWEAIGQNVAAEFQIIESNWRAKIELLGLMKEAIEYIVGRMGSMVGDIDVRIESLTKTNKPEHPLLVVQIKIK